MLNAKTLNEEEFFYGHKACAGCGGSLAVRIALKVLGEKAVAVLPAGCMSAVGFNFPQLCFSNNAIISTFAGTASMMTGVLAGLKARGIKIGLMTNTFSDERDFVRSCELFTYFDVPLISYEIGICKPSQEMFSKMTELLGVPAAECLYVGDGGSRELYAARDAGMKAVQCTWFHELAFEPHVPCPILDDFEHAEKQMDVLKFL